jgi:hypothetical protein
MTPLSPLDALGPAFRRTREVLASPFRLGFFLKIALIAALTQPSFYSATISYPVRGGQLLFLAGHSGGGPGAGYTGNSSQFLAGPGMAALGISVIAVMAILGVAVWVFFSYLYCRLRFTLFDLVVYKRGRVGRAWSAYRRQSWRYFGLVILVSLGFLAIAAIALGAPILNFIRKVRPLGSLGPNVNPFALLGAMLPLLLAAFAVALLWAVVDAVMQDFLLPPMAIDDAPLESAFGRFFDLARTNAGSVAVYVLLRFVVSIALTWVLLFVFFAVALIAGLAIYGIGTLIYHALWASAVGRVVCVALAILAGLVVLMVYLLAMIAIYGTAAIFQQSYAAYFFGGRYAALGVRLEPPPPPAPVEYSEPPPLPQSGPPPLEEAPPVW